MPIRFFFLIITLAAVVSNVRSQPGFNQIYSQYSVIDNFSYLAVVNDTIICVGSAYDTTLVSSPLQILLVKIDSNGNKIQSRLYRDSLDAYLSSDFYSGDLVRTSTGHFIFPVAVFGRSSIGLVEIDKDLNVVSRFEYPLGNNFVEFYDQILEMPDGGFMIAGSASRPNYKQDGFIRRIDKLGNVLWFKYYGNYNTDENFLNFTKINDNRFLAGGCAGPDLNDLNNMYAGLWLLDSNGVVIQKWVGTQYPDLLAIVGLLSTPDGGFIGHGRRYLGENTWGSKLQCCILKFNANLQLQWMKNIGPYSTENIGHVGIFDMIQTSDGNYLLAGQRRPYDSSPTANNKDWGGWLYKFSPEGDSIWARADNAPAGLKPSGEFVYGGVGLLSSGSIVAAGPGDINNIQVGWVVKVSADGCLDSALCLATAVHTPEEENALQIAPNPANELVNITFPACAQEHARLCLYNAQGVLVQELAVQEGETSHTLALQHLPPGWYMVCWVVDTRVLGRARLVHLGH